MPGDLLDVILVALAAAFAVEGYRQGFVVGALGVIGFLGGAQNTNEECYLFQKAARLLGLAYVEHQARL